MCFGGKNTPKPSKITQRDYEKEYDTYHSQPEQAQRRASRDKARDLLESKGLVSKGDGMDVDHIDRNPLNNSRSNLSIKPKSENRSRK
jgi:hypothetical protein